MTPAEAAQIEAGLHDGFRSDAAIIGESHARTHEGWCARRVDEFVSVMFAAQRWSVLDLPGVQVGDRVYCRPCDQADVLHVSGDHSGHPYVCAPLERARSDALASAQDLPALPREPILGTDYVRHPAPVPIAAGSYALCLACPHRLAAQEIAATGVKG